MILTSLSSAFRRPAIRLNLFVADLPDVENALVSTIATALYPSGGNALVPSAAGPICKIFRGWPLPTPGGLDADLAAGIVTISVFTESGAERNTTRCQTDWQMMTPAAPQITLAVALNVVTVSGTVQAGDFAAVKVGIHDYFSVATTGSAAATATALAAAIAVKYVGTVAVGAVITIPTSAAVLVAAGGLGTSWKELRRQSQLFQITAWCPTPASRDLVGPFIKNIFADVERIALADNSWGGIKYQRSIVTDKNQTQQSYRRDFFYSVEFPTSITAQFPSIGVFSVNTTGGVSPADTPAAVVTVA